MKVQGNFKPKKFIERIDWPMVILFALLSLIGVLCIYSVEHRDTDISLFMKNTRYAKQAIFLGASIVIGFIIIFMDSKFFTSIPFLGYLIGMLFL